ncbi:MAG TPA: hypothetical protein VNX23_14765 [Bradyrhizobium sp.]|jgi:hypothetical protein|uniref:hypothetical protein n=1 Tax=Bradyrhizobium sp. TaxID=376 RepID=UPI002C2024F1|nr:hypothetical protein [Bradyrhizobium sp.]HXB78643.1 hypothetical protein [Bradyrhizobium sp.]
MVELVECCPILFAMVGHVFGGPNGPHGARVDGGKFAGDLKIREIFPAGLEGAGLD